MRARGVHCSYHKCLTGLTASVFHALWAPMPHAVRRYQHFNSEIDRFLDSWTACTVSSLNNHVLPPPVRDSVRVSRFVRDPRDLVVSGYFYHRRGAEPWCLKADPTPEDFVVVHGTVPSAISAGESFSECLLRLPIEEGLLAEMEFRTRHFESMRSWPDSPDVLVQRYEDVLEDLPKAYARIAAHFGLTAAERLVLRRIVAYRSSDTVTDRSSHVRNPAPSQWREHFTPRVTAEFNDRWGDIVERYGYRR